jgi:hypothetical protein
LQGATAIIAERGLKDAEEGGAAASDYLRLLGLVAMGYCFAKASKIAAQALAGQPGRCFYKAKIDTARFFFEKLLPQSASLYLTIKAGKGAVMDFAEAAF